MNDASGPEVLIFEEQQGPLSLVAFELARSGYPVSYAPGVDEARLMAAEWAERIRVLVFPDDLEERPLAFAIGALKAIPRLIVAGESPVAAHTSKLFDLGVSWGVYGPRLLERLRVVLDVSLDLAPIVFGQTPFITTALGVRVENAGDPASRQPGRIRILSRNGAFIETELQTPPGGRIEIELDEGSPTRLRARVAIRNGAGTPMLQHWPCGLGVSLSFSSDETRRQVHERIESDPEAFRLIV